MTDEETTALAEALAERRPETSIVHASPEQFASSFDAYQQIQRVIDERMPNEIMDIRGKKFRKKAYWRAVATAFNIDVTPHRDDFFEAGDDWGYKVTCIAKSPNGRQAVGDGACMASEKKRKDGSMVDATHHNVRGHAFTRAFNRAVSNLVGFGEVSAEEVQTGSSRSSSSQSRSSQPRQLGSRGEWDGTVKLRSGKNAGKMWKEMNSGFLDWALKQDGGLKECAAKEAKRRVLADETSQVVDGEVVEEGLPLEGPPPDDPRFQ